MKHIQILIISRADTPCKKWAAFLCRNGWEVKVCGSCGEARQAAGGGSINLILLDETMVGELPAGQAKVHDGTVAIILFAGPGTLPNKKIADYLGGGYADIILSDIDPRVLEAKLLVNLRWALPVSARALEEVRSRSGLIKVSKKRHTVVIKKTGGPFEISCLTQTEIKILSLLVGREGNVVERGFILDAVWRGRVVNLENVDKHVETLRAKLTCFGRNIETVYGAGYCYRER